MATLYSNNFDAETAGTLPTDWNNNSGTWQVTTTNAYSGNALSASTTTAGDVTLYTGQTAQGDCIVTISQKVVQAGSGNTHRLIGPIYRMGSNYQNGYLWLPAATTGDGKISISFFRRSTSWTQVQAYTDSITGVLTNDRLWMEAKVTGTSHEFRIWTGTVGNRPSSATHTNTDSNYSSGHPGLYYSGNGTIVPSVDEFIYEDQGGAATYGFPFRRTNAAFNSIITF